MKLCEAQRPAENGCPPTPFINACEGVGEMGQEGGGRASCCLCSHRLSLGVSRAPALPRADVRSCPALALTLEFQIESHRT